MSSVEFARIPLQLRTALQRAGNRHLVGYAIFAHADQATFAIWTFGGADVSGVRGVGGAAAFKKAQDLFAILRWKGVTVRVLMK